MRKGEVPSVGDQLARDPSTAAGAPAFARLGASPALACVPRFGANVRNWAEISLGQAGSPAGKQSLCFAKSTRIRNNPTGGAEASLPGAARFPRLRPWVSPPCASRFPKQRFCPTALNPASALCITRAPRTGAPRGTFDEEVRPGVLIVSGHNVKAKLK